jgi:hypothetical protein
VNPFRKIEGSLVAQGGSPQMGIYYYTEDEVVRLELLISRFRAMAIVRRMSKMCYSGEVGLSDLLPPTMTDEEYDLWCMIQKIAAPILCLENSTH